MKLNIFWIGILIVAFATGYTAGAIHRWHENAEINRLWLWMDIYQTAIKSRDSEIETQEQALRKFRLRLMECEAGKTEVKP